MSHQNSALRYNSYGRTLCSIQISSGREWRSTFFLQETDCVNSKAPAATNGLKDHKCEKKDLREHPPIPYVPKKDSVQETVSAFKDNHLKTLINKGTELRAPIWHSGVHKAILIHVGSAQEAIKKKGYFQSYEESSKTYAEHRNKIKQLKITELDGTSGQTGTSRTSYKNSKETTAEASSTSSTPTRRHNGWA